MLTCIARQKQRPAESSSNGPGSAGPDHAGTPNSKQAVKALTSQIKGMALKASGESGRLQRGGSSSRWGKEMEARLRVLSSGRRADPPPFLVEETEPREWVAQVEPGVLITFVSLPRGANHLKRIRFSRDMFNKWQAQKWWTDNYEKVMELYNVERLNQQAIPLPTPLRSEDEMSKMAESSVGNSPVTPPLTRETLPRSLCRSQGAGYSSSDSYEQHSKQSLQQLQESSSTPKYSSTSAATTKTGTSFVEDSLDSTPSNRSRQLSLSNASEAETEWVEEDEPGVYITVRALPGGRRELRRVRFSREQFGEMHARLWWEENRGRIHEQYL